MPLANCIVVRSLCRQWGSGLAQVAPYRPAQSYCGFRPSFTIYLLTQVPMKLADKVLIPLQPSIFDIHATHQFVSELLAHRRSEKVQIAVIGMRTREGTISTDQLRNFLQGLGVPLLGFLRDTQNYVHLAAHGLTLWDVASTRFQGDREQWEPIVTWVN